MEKIQPQTEVGADGGYNITRKEALDIILEKCAKSKQQIAQGDYVTLEDMVMLTESQLKKLADEGAQD